MTFRRSISLVFLSLILAATSFAAPQKRRAVSPGTAPQPGSAPTATLTGTVIDNATGGALAEVNVSQAGRSGRTDAQGHFTIKIPIGVNTVLQFTRVGYETSQVTVNINGDTAQTFKLTPKATVHVRMTNGQAYDLDTETVEFGYVAPFSGYIKDTKLNLCKAGGESFQPDRADIKKITTGTTLTDATCCSSGPIPAINVELKAGGTTTAGFTDACFGYKVDIIAQSHTTSQPVYLHFADVAEVTFP